MVSFPVVGLELPLEASKHSLSCFSTYCRTLGKDTLVDRIKMLDQDEPHAPAAAALRGIESYLAEWSTRKYLGLECFSQLLQETEHFCRW